MCTKNINHFSINRFQRGTKRAKCLIHNDAIGRSEETILKVKNEVNVGVESSNDVIKLLTLFFFTLSSNFSFKIRIMKISSW